MDLRIATYTVRSFSIVEARHANEVELVFNTAGYTSTKPGAIKRDDDSELGTKIELFEEINALIASLPQESQDALYEEYARLDSVFTGFHVIGATGISAMKQLKEDLSNIIKAIYDIVPFSAFRDYIVNSPNIRLPIELADTYITTDKVTPLYKERTYLRPEYIDLNAYALGLRLMIPIWGGYLPIAETEHGKMKEYDAFKLLYGSALMDTPVFDRLERYLAANLDASKYELSVVSKFLSADEVPGFLASFALIRKVSVAPLSAVSDKDHLMKIIYNYVIGDKNRIPPAFASNIRDKKPEDSSSEGNESVWGIFKMKAKISTGDLCIIEEYIEKYSRAAKKIAPTLSDERIEMCVQNALSLHNFDPSYGQEWLVMQVCSTIIVGTAIELMDRTPGLIAAGIVQAVLWEWDLPQLAILTTARVAKLKEGEIIQPMRRLPIAPALLEQFEVIYPYRTPEPKRGDPIQSTNTGVIDVEKHAAHFYRHDWVPQCPVELAKSYYRSDKTRRIEVTGDLNSQLGQMLVNINNF